MTQPAENTELRCTWFAPEEAPKQDFVKDVPWWDAVPVRRATCGEKSALLAGPFLNGEVWAWPIYEGRPWTAEDFAPFEALVFRDEANKARQLLRQKDETLFDVHTRVQERIRDMETEAEKEKVARQRIIAVRDAAMTRVFDELKRLHAEGVLSDGHMRDLWRASRPGDAPETTEDADATRG